MPKAAYSKDFSLAGDFWDSKGKHNPAPWHCQPGKAGDDWENGPVWDSFSLGQSYRDIPLLLAVTAALLCSHLLRKVRTLQLAGSTCLLTLSLLTPSLCLQNKSHRGFICPFALSLCFTLHVAATLLAAPGMQD